MSKNLSLASCFHYVFTAFPYENLGEKGFVLDQELKNEKDGLITQCLYVTPPSSKNFSPVALEFLEIIDEVEFLEALKKQNQFPSHIGREILRPGLRFCDEKNDITTESTFDLIGSIPIQIQSNKRKELYSKQFGEGKKNYNHPNGAKTIWGIYLGLSKKEKEEWSLFLGRNPNEKDQWILDDGTIIQCARTEDGLYEFMEARKDFPFWAVILKGDSLSEVEKHFEFDKTILWNGKKSLLIKEHLTDWDVIVI